MSGTYCWNCGMDLEDPKNAGFPFKGRWYCSGFCAQLAAGFWDEGNHVTDFNGQIREVPA